MKRYFSKNLKKVYGMLFLAMFGIILATPPNLLAEEIQVGTGTATSNYIVYGFYRGGSGTYIYSSNEIVAAGGDEGTITRFALNFGVFAEIAPIFTNFTIAMANTATENASAMGANQPAIGTNGIEQVFTRNNISFASLYNEQYGTSGNYTNNSWMWITLDTPFEYTGGNLLVKICYYRSTYAMDSRTFIGTNNNMGMFNYDDATASPCTTTPPLGSIAFRPNIKIDVEMGPTIKDVFPRDTVLAANAISGDILIPNVKFNRKATDPPIKLEYVIRTSNNQIAFQGTEAVSPYNTSINVPTNLVTTGTAPNQVPVTYTFGRANGTRADNSQTPARMNFRSNQVAGGFYTTTATLKYLKDGDTVASQLVDTFEVIYDNDLTIISIEEPKSYTETGRVYPLTNQNILFSTIIRNNGRNPVSNFDMLFKVTNPKDPSYVVEWPVQIRLPQPLLRNQDYTYEINEFNPVIPTLLIPGEYILSVSATIVGGVTEPYLGDNEMRVDMYLDYPYDGEIISINAPQTIYNTDSITGVVTDTTGKYYVNQSIYPNVIVRNNAIFTASAVPLHTIIINEATGDTVWVDDSEVPSMPASTDIEYRITRPFFPSDTGTYRVEYRISEEEDYNTSDNMKSAMFVVMDGLIAGKDYTIGSASTNDFTTLQSAVKTVYEQGFNDTITFVLNDPVYYEGSDDDKYGLEFASALAGTNPNRLIRFVPSRILSNTRGAIKIIFRSKSGVGLYFGSALESVYPNAPVNLLKTSTSTIEGERSQDYYGFNFKVEFDGGSHHAIQFQMAGDIATSPIVSAGLQIPDGVASDNLVPVMIGVGASNITIKNCVILGRTIATPKLPEVYYDHKWNKPIFQDMNNVSAGILIRNVVPVDIWGVNSVSLDTLLINNIKIENNIIEGGSYGIIATGIGPLYNHPLGYFTTFYNHNNSITGNTINTSDIAGIFLGFEDNTTIKNNNIYIIGYSSVIPGDVAGIMLGGFGKGVIKPDMGFTGYNNIDILVDGNEISKINAPSGDAYGIRIEQELSNYIYYHQPGNYLSPNGSDSINVINNVVWGLSTDVDNISGSRYGVRLFGSRIFNPANKFDGFTMTRDTTQWLSYCKITNNTVVIEDDGKQNDADAYIGGIVAQDITNFEMYNNAVAMLDTNNLSDVVAPVVIQSVLPNETNKISIDNNVYWAEDLTLIRYIQTNPNKYGIRNVGSRNQYVGLEQWQYTTKADASSYVNNFYDNLYITRTNPQSLRINIPAPIGSYLSNRGRSVGYVLTDIFGNQRGTTSQDYDIGAWEFEGDIFDNDIAVTYFEEPISNRDYSHPIFNEAEYLMTKLPINVKVAFRNNGGDKVDNRPATLSVYQLNDNNDDSTLIGTFVKNLSIASMETKVLDYELYKDTTLEFPKTYAELNIVPPIRFESMKRNVTPIYRFVVTIPDDEDNTNNTNLTAKEVRYYLKQSPIGTIVSGSNLDIVPITTADYISYIRDNVNINNAQNLSDVISYMNYRALFKGLNDIGYFYDTLGFDVFDRTYWEPNSVNYANYRYMFWSDANNDSFTVAQQADIDNFMVDGTYSYKKNIILSSEEISRNMFATNTAEYGTDDFAKKIFGTTPKGTGIYSYTPESDNRVLLTGNSFIPNLNVTLNNTILVQNNKDVVMTPGIFESYGNLYKTAVQAFYYSKPTLTPTIDKTFGIASYSTEDNAIYLGADWRHYDDPGMILAAIMNYIGWFKDDQLDDDQMAVELLDFDAFVANNKVVIKWETASEINTSKFIVERMNNNVFAKILDTAAMGSNKLSNNYITTDANVLAGNTYTYRLNLIDFNGNSTYSNEKTISLDANSNFIVLDKPTPNPATDEINIKFVLSNETNVKISIYDLAGKEIAIITDANYSAGPNTLNFLLNNITSGNYNLVLTTDDGKHISHSFNVTK